MIMYEIQWLLNLSINLLTDPEFSPTLIKVYQKFYISKNTLKNQSHMATTSMLALGHE